MSKPDAAQTVITLSAADLPAYCPNLTTPIWSSHPRIYLDFAENGEAKCPYCSTVYRLPPGLAAGHH